ncbi:MAG: 50S ribosomal protein L19 [Candidatus Pacebacteria bacterium]|nr:50S ribosomal protein L19 [Candidatus Paceibacterota bacterium]
MAEEIKKVEDTTEEVKIEEVPKEEAPEVVLSEVDFKKFQLKKDIPEFKAGDMVKVYQKIKDKNKERVQAFEGQVLFAKHGKEIGATITVRKMVSGVGVEKTFPIHSPLVEKIEIVKKLKARRAKLYYLREAKGRKARLKAR